MKTFIKVAALARHLFLQRMDFRRQFVYGMLPLCVHYVKLSKMGLPYFDAVLESVRISTQESKRLRKKYKWLGKMRTPEEILWMKRIKREYFKSQTAK